MVAINFDSAEQANLTQCFFLRLEVVIKAALFDPHVFGDIPGAGTMETFFSKYCRSRPDRLQTLLLVFLAFDIRRHGVVPAPWIEQ